MHCGSSICYLANASLGLARSPTVFAGVALRRTLALHLEVTAEGSRRRRGTSGGASKRTTAARSRTQIPNDGNLFQKHTEANSVGKMDEWVRVGGFIPARKQHPTRPSHLSLSLPTLKFPEGEDNERRCCGGVIDRRPRTTSAEERARVGLNSRFRFHGNF